jgi:hypothetical protein
MLIFTFRFVSRRLLLRGVTVFAFVVWLFAGLSSARGADSLTLGQSQLGNVFLRGETVKIPVQTTGDSVEWTVSDFYGVTTSGGAAVSVSNDRRAVIRPAPPGRLGYFELHLTAKHAGKAVAQADTAFAVVAPSDISTMADSPFGVMTHFAQGWNTDIMPLIARAGLRHIRDEQYWATVESERGHYVFNDSYRAYMKAAAANELAPLMALTFDNNQYDHDPKAPGTAWAPCTDDGRTGFANYAGALLAQYPSQIETVEVWNEYNGSWCNGPASSDRPAFYTKMLQATYKLVKKQRPDVRVLGGAAVLTPLPWFEDLFNAGALDALDSVVIHPYVGAPEDAEKDVAALQDLIARYNHGGSPKSIWATECSAADPAHPGRQDMARYLVRLLTILRSAGVERIYWYLMRDYNDFKTGLVHSGDDPMGRYAPTSAYSAYSTLIQQLYHAQFVRREATDLRTRAYLFNKGGNELRVVWSAETSSRLLLMTEKPLTVTDIMGNSRVLQPQDGAVELAVDNNPVYVQGAVDNIHEIRRDLLLADSVEGFSGAQGTAPGTWSYGYYYQGDSKTYRPTDFKPLVWTRNSWGYRWQCAYPYAAISSNVAHPSDSANQQVWSIRRWQSNTAGTVRITGAVNRASKDGDGTGAKILIDGVEVFSQIVGGPGRASNTSFDLSVTLKKGSLVDFVVTPGPGGNINYDAVDYRAQVTQLATLAPTTYKPAAMPIHRFQ